MEVHRIMSLTALTSVIKSTTTGFYKFLARFSGRRRNCQKNLQKIVPYATIFLLLTSVCRITEACSSRTTPKPRPPTPTPRPNITFHTYKCPPAYAAWYCLNEATCFTVKIGDSLLYNCECADGYMGPRCEYKDLDGSYLPTRPRVMLETASIASGATVALLSAIIFCIIFCVRWHRRQKLARLTIEENGIVNGVGVDTVDGLRSLSVNGTEYQTQQPQQLQQQQQQQQRRPFGPHHYHTIAMSESLRR